MANRFDAFLSYSRTSTGPLTSALQQGLQRFAKPWNQLRAMRVFRDDANLAAGTSLWTTITTALSDSDWFVLVASPAAAASEYVNNEVKHWIDLRGGTDHVLLVHAGGTIGWDRAAGTFTATTDCIPPSLRQAFADEPRWIDLTWWDGVADGANDPRFTERVADLAAAIREVERDTMIGEDVRQHRRTRRITQAAIAVLSVLLVVSIISAFAALRSANDAAQQRDVALTRLISSQARVSSATDLEQAIVLADTAYQSARGAEQAETLYDVAAATPQLLGFITVGGQVTSVDATPDGDLVVAGTAAGEVMQFSRSTKSRTRLGAMNGEISFVGISDDGRTVVACATAEDPNNAWGNSTWARWQDGTGGTTEPGEAVALSPSGKTVAVLTHEPNAAFDADKPIDLYGPTGVRHFQMPSLHPSWVVLPDDLRMTALNEYGVVVRVGTDRTVQRGRIPMGTYMFGGSLSADGDHFTYTNGDEMVSVWDLTAGHDPEVGMEPQFQGASGSATVSGISLSPDGSRLVTAADGRLFASGLTPVEAAAPAVQTLEGAGAGPHALRFVSDHLLVNATGASVAVWDLARTNVLAHAWPVAFSPARNAVPLVTVNNVRTAATVQGSQGFHLVDLATGDVQSGKSGSWVGTSSATVWLDDKRMLVVNPVRGEVAVLTDEEGVKGDVFPLPGGCDEGIFWSAIATRADGRVVVLTQGSRLLIDTAERKASCDATNASALTSDGEYLVQVPELGATAPAPPRGVIEVFAADTLVSLGTVTIDALPLGVADVTAGGQLTVLAHDQAQGVVQTVKIDTTSWHVSSTQVLKTAAASYSQTWGARVDRGRMVLQEGTTIVLYDLDTAGRLPLFDVGSSVTAPPGFGFSPDGRTLAVSAHADGKLYVLPLDPAEWSTTACKRVWGATGGPDLARQLSESKTLKQGCAV